MLFIFHYFMFALTLEFAEFSFKARKIAEAGRTFARDNLMPDKIYCYVTMLFRVIF